MFGQRIDSAFVRDMATSASNPIVVFPASGDSAVSSSTQFDRTLLAQFRSVARGSQKLVRLGAWAIMVPFLFSYCTVNRCTNQECAQSLLPPKAKDQAFPRSVA